MVLMNSEGQTVGSPVDPTNDKESCPATPSKDCFKVDNGKMDFGFYVCRPTAFSYLNATQNNAPIFVGVNYVMVTGIAESGPLVVKLTAGGKSMTATINAAAWTSGSSAIVLANLALLFFFH
ncbi:unnamed protein product [Dibothriocephalus latus]|uniref:Uncharacterized protein n=1 Tax=Dibothriocephalus latus TaxID=60516 RepID=A0A3P6SNH9_DIBLA|nr:unnamed protein product [Dibothriocephalus latus]